MSVFFISDLHLGHDKVIEFGGRSWASSAEEHSAILIDRINTTVSKRDKLFILGDIAFTHDGIEAFKKIQCKNKEAIWGNHDPIAKLLPLVEKWHAFRVYKEFWLSHCPIHPNELRGRKNIHGHVHNKTILDDRYISVCVEACNGYPVRYDDLITNEAAA